jgi:hypothetical protein
MAVPYANIAQILKKLSGVPGNYLWIATAPVTSLDKHPRSFAVYLGKADDLKERLSSYINMDGTFGPKDELTKRAMMLNLQRRGFSIEIRWRRINGDPKTAESLALEQYNFPACYMENDKYRAIMLPSGRSVLDYPVDSTSPAQKLYLAVLKELKQKKLGRLDCEHLELTR